MEQRLIHLILFPPQMDLDESPSIEALGHLLDITEIINQQFVRFALRLGFIPSWFQCRQHQYTRKIQRIEGLVHVHSLASWLFPLSCCVSFHFDGDINLLKKRVICDEAKQVET